MIVYLVKSTLLLAVLWLLYRLLLENEKMHHFNRYFLLFALLFGLATPFISFEISSNTYVAGIKLEKVQDATNKPAEVVDDILRPLTTNSVNVSSPYSKQELGEENYIPVRYFLWATYGFITSILFIRFLIGLKQIRNKIIRNETRKIDGARLVLMDTPIIPQSFFNWIFINRNDFNSGKIGPEILEHELTHVRNYHSLDILLVEFLKVVFWFNPVIYLYKYAIQLNHEFQADAFVINHISGIDKYQLTLLNSCSYPVSTTFTSCISYNLFKKRFKMMIQEYSLTRSLSKKVILLPLSLSVALLFCTKPENLDKLYSSVDLEYRVGPADSPRPSISYTKTGKPFTGTQQLLYKKDNRLYLEVYYRDGIQTGSARYENGEITHQYEMGVYQGSFYSKKEWVFGVLTHQEITPEKSPDGMGYITKWHNNGQLKYEATYSGNYQYHGLMTLYNEDGSIAEQELYKNGAIIEKKL